MSDGFSGEPDQPEIGYSTRPVDDAVARLNRKLESGEVRLERSQVGGYLRAVLNALHVPVESQLVVFSKTSFQSERISPTNPRSIFFNDSVVVGWVRGGPLLELAAEAQTSDALRQAAMEGLALLGGPASHDDLEYLSRPERPLKASAVFSTIRRGIAVLISPASSMNRVLTSNSRAFQVR